MILEATEEIVGAKACLPQAGSDPLKRIPAAGESAREEQEESSE